MRVPENHPIRSLSPDGVNVTSHEAFLTDRDVQAMLNTLDQWESSVPCWHWRVLTFDENDRIRAHAMGVAL
jgi:hypothetical protein